MILKLILFLLLPFFIFGQTETYYYDGGQVSIKIIQLDSTFDLNRHIITYYENGQKKEDYFDKNKNVYDTLKKWTPKGELYLKEIYSDNGYTEINYHYETGQIYETGNYELVHLDNEEITIIDSIKFDKYISVKCKNNCYQRIGTWKTFHKNGQLESKGQYLPQKFETSYPIDGNNKSFEMVPDTIYDTVSLYLKDKIWLYYDENGKKIREELYIDGLLKK